MTETLFNLPEIVHSTEAWFWIPLIILAGGLGGAAVGAVLAAIFDSTPTTKVIGKSLGILGMQEAGKTQVLRNLQNKPYSKYEATSTDDYSSFKINIGGREITIQQGRDIGGDERYIKDYYEDFIKHKDIILFVFDVAKYLKDFHYAQNVRVRLDFVYNKLKMKLPDGTSEAVGESVLKRKHLTIGSHADNLSDEEKKSALSKLQESVKGKPYSIMFHNNLLLCDLTKKVDFLKGIQEKKLF